MVLNRINRYFRERKRRKLDYFLASLTPQDRYRGLFALLDYYHMKADGGISYERMTEHPGLKEITNWFIDSVQADTECLVDPDRINYFLEVPFGCDVQLEDRLVKKMAVFGETVTVISTYEYEIPPGAAENRELTKTVVPSAFLRDLVRYRPLLTDRIVLIIPTYFQPFWNSWALANAVKENRIGLDYRTLKNYLATQEGLAEVGQTNVLIPHLANIKAEMLAKLRRDEGDTFRRFQHRLRAFLKDSSTTQSEAKLFEAIRQLDYEIRVLDERFKTLCRMRSLRAGQVVAQCFAIALCQFAPPELAKMLSAFLGGLTLHKLTDYFIDMTDKSAGLRESDFYFPWRVLRESGALKGKR